jgi:hypothetical protein
MFFLAPFIVAHQSEGSLPVHQWTPAVQKILEESVSGRLDVDASRKALSQWVDQIIEALPDIQFAYKHAVGLVSAIQENRAEARATLGREPTSTEAANHWASKEMERRRNTDPSRNAGS